MKKALLLVTLTLLQFFTFILNPTQTQAATLGPNQFVCEQSGFSCQAGQNTCQPGFEPDNTKCSPFGGSSGQCVDDTRVFNCSTTSNPPPISTTCDKVGNPCCGSITSLLYCSPSSELECGPGFVCRVKSISQPLPPPNLPNPPEGNSSFNPWCVPGQSVNTAIGCISTNPTALISQILGWSISVGSGVTLLIIIYAAFSITTAHGDPKKMQAGQELLTAAISGLIVIIFSITILNFVGVTVLKIPNFGAGL